MRSLGPLLSRLPRLSIRKQEHVKALLYDHEMLLDQESSTGLDLKRERQAIQEKISSCLIDGQPDHLATFRWYGGKKSKLDFILPKLPESESYIEPFGGSAAVLLNRPPSKIEVFNDLDGELINFYSVLRDHQTRELLLEQLMLTPYSREEFLAALEPQPGSLTEVERARLFFAKATQVRNGQVQSARPGNWSYSRKGINKSLESKLSLVTELPFVAERLLHVSIENLHAFDVIIKYDAPGALIYCDPPYVHSSRSSHKKSYFKEMSDGEHRELAEVLGVVQGKVAISGYDDPLYRELYRDWNRHADRPKQVHGGKKIAQEILWTNY
jgi:DNA adenine methylase